MGMKMILKSWRPLIQVTMRAMLVKSGHSLMRRLNLDMFIWNLEWSLSVYSSLKMLSKTIILVLGGNLYGWRMTRLEQGQDAMWNNVNGWSIVLGIANKTLSKSRVSMTTTPAAGCSKTRPLEKWMLTQPNMTRTEAYEHMKVKYNTHLNMKKVSSALQKAKKSTEGSEKEQYRRIREYVSKLLRSNLGSTCRLQVLP